MLFSGEAVYRTFAGGTLIFVVSGNVDEVRPIKSTSRLRAGRRWLGQDGSNARIRARPDLLRTEVATISYGFKPGLTHRIASGSSHRAELRPIIANIGDLMSDDQMVLCIYGHLYVVADHSRALATCRHQARILDRSSRSDHLAAS